jgi:hypothetical protein
MPLKHFPSNGTHCFTALLRPSQAQREAGRQVMAHATGSALPTLRYATCTPALPRRERIGAVSSCSVPMVQSGA